MTISRKSTELFTFSEPYRGKDACTEYDAKGIVVISNEGKSKTTLTIIFGDCAEFRATTLPNGIAITALHNCESASMRRMIIELGKALESAGY